mmetsp:Transcript_25328/g.63703  ORF Transcript_25328/g.63703 Transcript_25328/m.63703 type:complete len:274 (+) Transcript_25328:856-1677(+)
MMMMTRAMQHRPLRFWHSTGGSVSSLWCRLPRTRLPRARKGRAYRTHQKRHTHRSRRRRTRRRQQAARNLLSGRRCRKPTTPKTCSRCCSRRSSHCPSKSRQARHSSKSCSLVISRWALSVMLPSSPTNVHSTLLGHRSLLCRLGSRQLRHTWRSPKATSATGSEGWVSSSSIWRNLHQHLRPMCNTSWRGCLRRSSQCHHPCHKPSRPTSPVRQQSRSLPRLQHRQRRKLHLRPQQRHQLRTQPHLRQQARLHTQRQRPWHRVGHDQRHSSW